ncbi:hypothetical protein E2C01_029550 [Portunus trituberculatus]|uniref:Uncharacterized protein n=1 Tax=Portunus trituberculatus TaxID=210409 RepID=A0A5B7ET83_PORTR|nr:hypothetical protein [Portunus trituberculatus]
MQGAEWRLGKFDDRPEKGYRVTKTLRGQTGGMRGGKKHVCTAYLASFDLNKDTTAAQHRQHVPNAATTITTTPTEGDQAGIEYSVTNNRLRGSVLIRSVCRCFDVITSGRRPCVPRGLGWARLVRVSECLQFHTQRGGL